MPYTPTNPPVATDIAQLTQWIFEELQNISKSQVETNALDLRTIHQEPIRPREGMQVHADGTDWNPGSGEGTYVYQGGAWVKSFDGTDVVPVANGGTGQTTEAEALGEMIQALTEDTSPDPSADFGVTYDASADTGKKVALMRYGMKTNMGSQATTSGSSKDFTSIPAGVKRIQVVLNGVSLSGTDNLLIQIGDSGGLETSGYLSKAGVTTGGFTSSASSTAGFIVAAGNAASVVHGIISLVNITGNTWVAAGAFHSEATYEAGAMGGSKSLSATLDRVSLLATGANTFDAGNVTVLWEF